MTFSVKSPRMMLRAFISPLWCALVLFVPSVAIGQTTFTWNTARRDTLYQTVEACLGLVNRVKWQNEIPDTLRAVDLPSSLYVPLNTVSEIVTTTARRCSQQFSVAQLLAADSLDLPATLNAVKLFIQAKRDADVLALIEGWIAKLPADDSIRTYLLGQTATMAMEDLPTRYALVRRLADSLNFAQAWDVKIMLYGKIMNRAQDLKDTATFESAAAWLITVPKILSDSLRATERWRVGNQDIRFTESMWPPGHYVTVATTYQYRTTILAKLRQSVDSFRVFMDIVSKEIAGAASRGSAPTPFKPLVADYWFPAKPQAEHPKTPGKIGYVFLITQPWECKDMCLDRGIRSRIIKKFPQIEYTALTRTYGYYGERIGTLPPDQEARMIDSVNRTLAGFPGTLAVHHTQFWRIDDTYDRRVVEEVWGLEPQYPLFLPTPISYRIIDWNGEYIEAPWNLDFDEEKSHHLFLEALLQGKPK